MDIIIGMKCTSKILSHDLYSEKLYSYLSIILNGKKSFFKHLFWNYSDNNIIIFSSAGQWEHSNILVNRSNRYNVPRDKTGRCHKHKFKYKQIYQMINIWLRFRVNTSISFYSWKSWMKIKDTTRKCSANYNVYVIQR